MITEFVRNVTITLDEETAQWARVEAARQDTSVSRWVGQLLEERRRNTLDYERARRSYLQRRGAAHRCAEAARHDGAAPAILVDDDPKGGRHEVVIDTEGR